MYTVRVETPNASRQFTFAGTKQALIALLAKKYPSNAQVTIK